MYDLRQRLRHFWLCHHELWWWTSGDPDPLLVEVCTIVILPLNAEDGLVADLHVVDLASIVCKLGLRVVVLHSLVAVLHGPWMKFSASQHGYIRLCTVSVAGLGCLSHLLPHSNPIIVALDL